VNKTRYDDDDDDDDDVQDTCIRQQSIRTCTVQLAAITPSTGLSEKGSNILSGRRMKSGFNRYLHSNNSHAAMYTAANKVRLEVRRSSEIALY